MRDKQKDRKENLIHGLPECSAVQGLNDRHDAATNTCQQESDSGLSKAESSTHGSHQFNVTGPHAPKRVRNDKYRETERQSPQAEQQAVPASDQTIGAWKEDNGRVGDSVGYSAMVEIENRSYHQDEYQVSVKDDLKDMGVI